MGNKQKLPHIIKKGIKSYFLTFCPAAKYFAGTARSLKGKIANRSPQAVKFPRGIKPEYQHLTCSICHISDMEEGVYAKDNDIC